MDWQEEKLVCPNCKQDVIFRVAFKKAQFKNGKHWDDIIKSAEIVLCANCGHSIYISPIKVKASL
jgi:predicted RNA-binding Zn-ribbon protein involved in translation (DUF1610 family)